MSVTLERPPTRKAAPASWRRRWAAMRGARSASPAFTVGIACAGFFMIVLDTTVVNLALPHIGADLGGGVTGLQWVVDGYTVVLGAFVLSAGGISDRIGASATFARSLALFGVSSAACGFAPSLGVLLGARACQGLAAALMLPSSLALAGQAYADPARRARTIALWATAGAVAVAAGPVVGGLLTDSLGWRSVFFVNVPIAAVALLGTLALPHSPRRPAHLDLGGQVAAVLALGGVTYGVIEGAHRGFGSPPVVAALVIAAVAGVLFVAIEHRTECPAVPLHLLANRAAAGTIGVGVAAFFSFYGVIFTLSIYFQRVLHDSPTHSGLLFIPMTAVIALVTTRLGALAHRIGVWIPMAAGMLLMEVGATAMLALDGHSAFWEIALVTLPLGLGSAFAAPCVPLALLGSLPHDQAGIASGIMHAVRQGSATLGVAVFGALVAGHVGFVHGMRTAFLVSALGLGAGVVLAVVWVRPKQAAPGARPARRLPIRSTG
jgi:MFS transporter, DHA2 family, methylenomycin A resistance protein